MIRNFSVQDILQKSLWVFQYTSVLVTHKNCKKANFFLTGPQLIQKEKKFKRFVINHLYNVILSIVCIVVCKTQFEGSNSCVNTYLNDYNKRY